MLTAVRRRQRRPVHDINEEIVNSDTIISAHVNMQISIYISVCLLRRVSAFTDLYSNVSNMYEAYGSSPITIKTQKDNQKETQSKT